MSLLAVGVLLAQEYVTRNAHELWCADRLAEGWEFAPSSNHLAKVSASLRPFDGLHESQQATLRQASLTLVKLLLKHGYHITPKDGNAMKAVEEWTFAAEEPDGPGSAWIPNPCRLGQDLSLAPDLHDIARVAAREDHLVRRRGVLFPCDRARVARGVAVPLTVCSGAARSYCARRW